MKYQLTNTMNRFLFFFVLIGIGLPFIFLKDSYPFHRFGMFAEPLRHQTQYEKFYIFYKKNNTNEPQNNWIRLQSQTIPLNANAFDMQLRKHHYQNKHADFVAVFDEIIRKKTVSERTNLKEKVKLKWKWYHVTQHIAHNIDLQNELDSLCVFSK